MSLNKKTKTKIIKIIGLTALLTLLPFSLRKCTWKDAEKLIEESWKIIEKEIAKKPGLNELIQKAVIEEKKGAPKKSEKFLVQARKWINQNESKKKLIQKKPLKTKRMPKPKQFLPRKRMI